MRRTLALAAAVALTAPAVATAHVDVLPEQVVAGQPTLFTVRVPNERGGPATTAVRVVFPRDVTVYSFAPPPPGWTMTTQTSPDGRLSGVVYRGSLPKERFQDFTFLGNAFTPGKGVWKAYQTYADGKIKPWTTDPATASEGETGPTDPGPGSALTVLPEGSQGTATAAAASPAPGGSPGDSARADGDGDGMPLWLGLLGVGLGAAALLAVGFLWTTRPMNLPDDE